jgi:hypothetical protein
MSIFGIFQAVLFAVMVLILVPMAFLRLAAPSLLREALHLVHADDAPLVLARGAHLPFLIVVFWFATTHRSVGANSHHLTLLALALAAVVALKGPQPREFAVWTVVAMTTFLILCVCGRVKRAAAAVRRGGAVFDTLLVVSAAIGVDRAAAMLLVQTFDWNHTLLLDMDTIVLLASVLLVALAVLIGTDNERLSASAALVVLKFTRLYPRLAVTSTIDSSLQLELASLALTILCFCTFCWSPSAPKSVPARPATTATTQQSESQPQEIKNTTPTTTATSSIQSDEENNKTPPLTPGRIGAAAAFRPRIITPVRGANGVASPAGSSQNLFRALVTPVCIECKSSAPTRSYIDLDGGKFICSQCQVSQNN